MKKVSYDHATQHFQALLDSNKDSSEIVCVKRKNGKEIVLVDAREYSSLKESAYLLSNKANADKILTGLEQAEKQKGKAIDLQNYLDS